MTDQAPFRPVVITVSMISGPREVHAWTADGVLAVNRWQKPDGEESELFVISHVATGRAMGSNSEAMFLTLTEAQDVARRLMNHPDGSVWTDYPFAFAEQPPDEWMRRGAKVFFDARHRQVTP